MYSVYILRCSDNSLYTGIAKNVKRRVEEHNSSTLGAKYTKARRPVHLVFSKQHTSRSEALKEEYRIKQLAREQKLELIKNHRK